MFVVYLIVIVATALAKITKKQLYSAAIPRKSWVLTENHRVCAKHFLADDFQTFSTDHRENRRAQRSTQELKQKRLKPAVIPHVFPGLPMYLSSTSVQNRGLSSTVSCRLEKENERRKKMLNFLQQMKYMTLYY